MSERISRFEVPADNRWHTRPAEYALEVGSRERGVVEFWCRDTDSGPREYRVYGTGHLIDGGPVYEGTTYDGSTKGLVWHLVSREVTSDE